MGQKVCPIGIRLAITADWHSNWYANAKDFPVYLSKDIALRKFLNAQYKNAQISKIYIERLAKSARVTVHSARPGILIGKSGNDAEKLRRVTSDLLGVDAHVKVVEVRKPDLDAKLAAMSIAQQLEKRVPFRRAMKRALTNAMRGGAEGIRICVSGRLAGAEIARSEKYLEGRVPLHTFRADIDYATARAYTTYGVIGVKVWIFKGEKMRTKGPANQQNAERGKGE